MLFFSPRNKKSLDVRLCGLEFANPVGFTTPADITLKRCWKRSKAGFLILTPPQNGILEWITGLQAFRQHIVLAVNIKDDILRNFSLIYDFADFIIIDPDSDNGISSPDISDTAQLLDEIVNLRLCYEHYTPVFLRLSQEDTPDEIHPLVSCARLSGVDGIVAPNPAKVRLALAECQARMPVIGVAQTVEEAMEELADGASLVETSLRPLGISILLKNLETKP